MTEDRRLDAEVVRNHPERRRVEEELRQERELHPVRGREGELVTLGAAQIIFRELWMPFGMTRNEDAADAVRGEHAGA